jgi:hypothetical protein
MAVNAAKSAQIANIPLNCLAGSTGETAEMTFCVGGKFP